MIFALQQFAKGTMKSMDIASGYVIRHNKAEWKKTMLYNEFSHCNL